MKNIIGKRITAALATQNVMQKQLAERLGVKPNIVSYWCSGQRTPNAEQIAEIAKILGVSADYLLGLTKSPTTDKDLQYICDVTGLSSKEVEFFCSSKYQMSKRFLDIAIQSIYFCEAAEDSGIYILDGGHSEENNLDNCIKMSREILAAEVSKPDPQVEAGSAEQDPFFSWFLDHGLKGQQAETALYGSKYYLTKAFERCLDHFISEQIKAGADDE